MSRTQRRLPKSYAELEYLESNGTQYINTGINPSGKKIGAVVDFQFTSTTRTTGGVFGSNKTDGTDNCQFTVYNSKWRVKLNGYATYGAAYDTNRHTARCNMPDGTSLDSTVYTSTQYTIASSNTNNVFVGACNYEVGTAETYTLIGKLYSAKVYDDTTLVRNLIPAKNRNTNVLGMYDLAWDGSQYGCIDLGNSNWNYSSTSNCFWRDVPSKALSVSNQYIEIFELGTAYNQLLDGQYCGNESYSRVYIRADEFNGNTTAFKAAMSGVMLYYQRTDDPSWASPWYINAGTGTFTAGPVVQTYDAIPTSKKNILYTSKNLLDKSKSTTNWINGSGQVVQYPNGEAQMSDYVDCEEGDIFTIRGFYNGSVFTYYQMEIAWYTSSKTFISRDSTTTTSNNSFTATAPSDAKYCKYGFYRIDDTTVINHDTMAVKGSTPPTSYQPYGQLLAPTSKSAILSKRLPDGYTELEYVMAQTAGPYIQLTNGFDATDEVEIKSKLGNTGADNYLVAPQTWNTNNNRFAMGGTYNNTSRAVGFGAAGTGQTKYNPGVTPEVNQITDETYSNKVFTIAGDNINSTVDATSIAFGEPTDNLKLFYGYNSVTAGSIYYWKHKKIINGVLTLVEYFIPAKNSQNVVGMYDLVSDTFLTNAGSGTFTAGPEVHRLYPTTKQLLYITYD